MDQNYYKEQFSKIEDYTNLSAEKQDAFSQNILLVSSSILGILISLHDNKTECLYTRVAFLISILFLVFGILTLAIMLYDRSKLVEHLRQRFVKEAQNALKEDRKLQMVSIQEGKRIRICKKISYSCLILALLMLIVYTSFSTFS